jgi:hypothetical protein
MITTIEWRYRGDGQTSTRGTVSAEELLKLRTWTRGRRQKIQEAIPQSDQNPKIAELIQKPGCSVNFPHGYGSSIGYFTLLTHRIGHF